MTTPSFSQRGVLHLVVSLKYSHFTMDPRINSTISELWTHGVVYLDPLGFCDRRNLGIYHRRDLPGGKGLYVKIAAGHS